MTTNRTEEFIDRFLHPAITNLGGSIPDRDGLTNWEDYSIQCLEVIADRLSSGGGGTVVITNNSVVSASISPAAVITEKIANSAITSVKIQDGAVTGDKIAAATVITNNLADGAVTAAKIQDGTITSTKIQDGTIQSGDLAAAAVTTSKIQDGAVTADKLAPGTISAASITDSGVTTAKLADGAVTTAKLADTAITSAKIQNGAITSAKIQDGTIATADIADGAITSAKIQDGSILGTDIQDLAIVAAKIANGTITSLKIADGTIITSDLAAGANDSYLHTNNAGQVVWLPGANIPVGDGSVTTAKLANNAVTSAKIADGTIQTTDLLPGANETFLQVNGGGVIVWAALPVSSVPVEVKNPGFVVQNSVSQLFPVNVWSPLNPGAAVRDVYAGYNAVSGTFTVPAGLGGLWQIICNWENDITIPQGQLYAAFTKNTTTVTTGAVAGVASFMTVGIRSIVLAAGDILRFYAYPLVLSGDPATRSVLSTTTSGFLIEAF